MKKCPLCAEQIQEDATKCRFCGEFLTDEARKSSSRPTAPNATPQPKEKHGVPALLSFFIPGSGQLIKGEIGKGIFMFIGALTFLLLSEFLIGIPFLIVVLAWSIHDAYNA